MPSKSASRTTAKASSTASSTAAVPKAAAGVKADSVINATKKQAAAPEPVQPEPEAGAGPRRPVAVTVVALMTGAVGALLLVYGIFLMAAGFGGKPVLLGRAELAGGIFVFFGLSLLWVARGLVKLQAWARTPAFITQLAFFGACYWLIQGHYYAGAVAAAVLGVLGSVLLFLPASNEVLNREVQF